MQMKLIEQKMEIDVTKQTEVSNNNNNKKNKVN